MLGYYTAVTPQFGTFLSSEPGVGIERRMANHFELLFNILSQLTADLVSFRITPSPETKNYAKVYQVLPR